MSHYKLLGGAIVISALMTFTSAVQADMNYGPSKVGDKCFTRTGPGEAIGYWDTCKGTGATANASIPRPARASGKRAQTAKKADR